MQTLHPYRLGHSQNFLHSRRLVASLVDRSTIGVDDLVLEIGPGRGIITELLADRCRHLIAVEKDPRLVARLRRRFADRPTVEIVERDFLDFPLPSVSYKVFASLPFAVTTAIVSKLVHAVVRPEDSYLVVQREAAMRFVGQPGETLFAVLLKPWFEPSIVHRFRRADFEPAPGVDVVMLRLRKRGPPLIEDRYAQLFRDFVVFAFTTWRPTLADSLALLFGRQRVGNLARTIGLDRHATPTRVRFPQWLSLFQEFLSLGDARRARVVAGAERQLRRRQRSLEKVCRTRAACIGRPRVQVMASPPSPSPLPG